MYGTFGLEVTSGPLLSIHTTGWSLMASSGGAGGAGPATAMAALRTRLTRKVARGSVPVAYEIYRSTDPGFTVSKTNVLSARVPVPTRPKPLKLGSSRLSWRSSAGWL